MPRRTNAFQHLVTLIERALAPTGASVRASEELADRHSGRRREVDIVVSHRVGPHEIVVSVECTASAREADVEWVEQLKEKHSSLPTNKLILVSRSGFTPQARTKAQLCGIDTYSLAEAHELNWESVVRKIPNIQIESFLLPYPVAITVVFEGTPDGSAPATEDLAHSTLIDPSGTPSGTAAEIVDRWLKNPNLVKSVQEHAFTDAGTLIEFEVPLKKGVLLESQTGSRHPVYSIRVQAKGPLNNNLYKSDTARYPGFGARLYQDGHESAGTGGRTAVASRARDLE